MVTYSKGYKYFVPAVIAVSLSGCGGNDDSLSDLGVQLQSSPLVCQFPEQINEAGTACEVPQSQCPLPLTDGDIPGTCTEFLGEWPEGGNGINMPEPVRRPAQDENGNFTEIVIYFNQESSDFDGWGMHAWNSAATFCDGWADFDVPDGGTDWGVPIQPEGIDPNFGMYVVMNANEGGRCGNFIPYNFDAGIQSDADLQVQLSNADVNPTGMFFVLRRNDADRYDAGTIFPYPRTFESLIVPGGGGMEPEPVECELPQVANEEGTECLDPIIGEFVPGEVTLYLRGGFNDWGNEENLNDTTAFHYADGIYTATMMIPAAESGAYEFKIADFDWTDETSFGGVQGGTEERTVPTDGTAVALLTGKLATPDDQDVEGNLRIVADQDAMYQFTLNASNPAAPTLSIISSPFATNLYLRGSMNEWGNDAEGNFALSSGVGVLRYEGENLYTTRLTLEASETAYNFKVADASWTAETNFGATAGDETLTLNEDKTLTFGEDSQNLQFTVAEAGTFILSMDVTDPMAPVAVIRNAIPYDATVYVRGGMNGWGLTDAMTYEGDGIYTAVIPIAGQESDLQFKVASEDWATADFGAEAGDEQQIPGEPKTLAFAGENIRLTVAADGDFMFHVDANERLSPVLTVRNLDGFTETPLFVRGSMNDWGAVDQMDYVGNGVYQAAIALTAGEYNFKVATEDWETANWGSDGGETTMVDAAFVTTPGETSGNITINVEADGTYLFSADVTNLTNPTVFVSPLARYGDTPVYVRGSMNEWGVTDEMTFDGVASYSLDLDLAAGDYAFKVASEDWATVNFGNPMADVFLNLSRPASLVGGEESQNINITIPEDAPGMYRFDFTVVNPAAPTLTVSPTE